MANVLSSSSPFGFYPRPPKDAPGFGFGFGSNMLPSGFSAPFQPSQSLAFNHLASTSNHNSMQRAQKRRHEPDEGSENFPQDESMDRSPTPERPKRAAPKRARTSAQNETANKEGKVTKDAKTHEEEHDVDIGVLLASLPPESLLPILTSLVNSQPSLKSAIIPLIPRPTLETALHALTASAKKLREAYPYSNMSGPSTSISFGFGSFSQPQSSMQHSGGMRESYIVNRLRPHISDFHTACISYLPYFSYLPTPSLLNSDGPSQRSHSASSSHKDKLHPNETYLFLWNLTAHILNQPPLTQESLEPLLFSRLSDEWNAWVDRVDVVVNQEAGMFGSDMVQGWVRGLDEFAGKDSRCGNLMASVRDRWVSKVGWLVGRTIQHPMES